MNARQQVEQRFNVHICGMFHRTFTYVYCLLTSFCCIYDRAQPLQLTSFSYDSEMGDLI